MPVRNEAWVLGLSARVALLWCDEICVLNHSSTDRTGDILGDLQAEFPGRVHVVSLADESWPEMAHRQHLLEFARTKKATHIALVDADEVLTGNLIGHFTTAIHCVWEREDNMVSLPGYNLRAGIRSYHLNGIWGNRWFSTAFKDDPRLHWGGDKFHSREPRGIAFQKYQPINQGAGGTMHLWGASERRLVARHAWYKMVERIRWPEKSVTEINALYSWAIHGDRDNPKYGTPATWQFADVPESWWAPYKNLLQYLDVHATPWQENECKRLLGLYGKKAFEGLDLFGVI